MSVPRVKLLFDYRSLEIFCHMGSFNKAFAIFEARQLSSPYTGNSHLDILQNMCCVTPRKKIT